MNIISFQIVVSVQWGWVLECTGPVSALIKFFTCHKGVMCLNTYLLKYTEQPDKANIVIGCVYRPPKDQSSDVTQFSKVFSNNLDIISLRVNKVLFIEGDYS